MGQFQLFVWVIVLTYVWISLHQIESVCGWWNLKKNCILVVVLQGAKNTRSWIGQTQDRSLNVRQSYNLINEVLKIKSHAESKVRQSLIFFEVEMSDHKKWFFFRNFLHPYSVSLLQLLLSFFPKKNKYFLYAIFWQRFLNTWRKIVQS